MCTVSTYVVSIQGLKSQSTAVEVVTILKVGEARLYSGCGVCIQKHRGVIVNYLQYWHMHRV